MKQFYLAKNQHGYYRVDFIAPVTGGHILVMTSATSVLRLFWHTIVLVEDISLYNTRKRIQEKIKNLPKEHRNLVEEQNKLIPLDMDERDAMLKWRELDFITPPPDRIKHIKQTYNMSWKEFKEHINTF